MSEFNEERRSRPSGGVGGFAAKASLLPSSGAVDSSGREERRRLSMLFAMALTLFLAGDAGLGASLFGAELDMTIITCSVLHIRSGPPDCWPTNFLRPRRNAEREAGFVTKGQFPWLQLHTARNELQKKEVYRKRTYSQGLFCQGHNGSCLSPSSALLFLFRAAWRVLRIASACDNGWVFCLNASLTMARSSPV